MIISYYCYGSGLSTPKVNELWRKAKSGLPPAFISKWTHSRSFIHRVPEATSVEQWQSSFNSQSGLQSLKYFLSDALQKQFSHPRSRQKFIGKGLYPAPVFVFFLALLIWMHLATVYMSASNFVCLSEFPRFLLLKSQLIFI